MNMSIYGIFLSGRGVWDYDKYYMCPKRFIRAKMTIENQILTLWCGKMKNESH